MGMRVELKSERLKKKVKQRDMLVPRYVHACPRIDNDDKDAALVGQDNAELAKPPCDQFRPAV